VEKRDRLIDPLERRRAQGTETETRSSAGWSSEAVAEEGVAAGIANYSCK
jgi:hypothetical protein